MCICELCKREFKNIRALAQHLIKCHKEITKEEYYIKYINKVSQFCICGKKKNFRNLGEGYRQFCSIFCRDKNVKHIGYWKNKKQLKDMIDKRVSKTDYKKTKEKREETNIKKYGVKNVAQIPDIKNKISVKMKGRKNPRKEHQQEKIIETKIKNGTTKHSEKTKIKIKNSLVKYYKNYTNREKYLSNTFKGKYITGYYNDIFFRSSYELKFLENCNKFNIKVESAENNKFAVKYLDYNGIDRMYYPDFYLPEFNIVIEVKPLSMLDYNNNLIKIDEACKIYSFILITEEELNDEELYINHFYI